MAETAPAPLLTFHAGRVDFVPPSKHLKPLPYKGQITLSRSTDEDAPLLSFVWEPRGSSKKDPAATRDELILFPGDVEWLPVPQCTTGRVYVLKFSSSSQRSFFWMQDPPSGDALNEISENDLKIATRINTLLEDVYADEVDISEDYNTEQTAVATSAATDDVEMTDITKTDTTSTTQSPNLSSLIRSIVIPPSGTTSSAAPIHEITDAISTQQIATYVAALDSADPRLEALYNCLPAEIPKTKPELLRVLQSPQFRQGVNSLSSTLRSAGGLNVGQLVTQELGIPYRGEGIEGFLRAIFAAVQEEQNDPEAMQEDQQ
ncbi:proteasome complex subunit Rpn13 ubiquitin receptor-domain-containing protein [Limtongia smithiae]|uniref:proteasome complex subunit Rpn13 ubiquitin receptor-domain-containing protein n=1 Tax=Limtongia smithiae TaxID=1125753 RepID=UPI0034CECBDA